ncbi:MAG: DNA-binding protein [Clostridia bacterium]|nr:DNA-binding protein [Clostridia bacterium]MBR4635661.1 DNA-binding protein [Clostridia bacterium]
MPDRIELSLLIDYYGAFLTENQRELIELSCDEDLSLSEIAEQKGISRQGVRDAIARGAKTLADMETKLHLISRDRHAAELIRSIRSGLSSLAEEDAGKRAAELAGIESMLSELSDMMEGNDGI